MPKYNTIYDYTSEKTGLEYDNFVMEIGNAIGKRFRTVLRSLYRANFKDRDKKIIINLIIEKGNSINNEDTFFNKTEDTVVSVR